MRHFLNLSDAGGDAIAAILNEAMERKQRRSGWPKGRPDREVAERRARGPAEGAAREIRAAVVRAKGGPFEIETLTLEAPRRDEVLVRMVATGRESATHSA